MASLWGEKHIFSVALASIDGAHVVWGHRIVWLGRLFARRAWSGNWLAHLSFNDDHRRESVGMGDRRMEERDAPCVKTTARWNYHPSHRFQCFELVKSF